MKAYQEERRKNLISYMAKRHRMATGERPYSMNLYKYLALFEFRCLENLGYMPLGYTYKAMELGPVPMELSEFRHLGENRYQIQAIGDPDSEYFSEDELAIVNSLIVEMTPIRRRRRTEQFSRFSHEQIPAWRESFIRQPNSDIDPADTFDLEFPSGEP